MKIDDRLNTLCREFADLDEAEKDYILGISGALAYSVSVGAAFLPVEGEYEAVNSRPRCVQYEEYLV